MKNNRPYPGVSIQVDRHGKRRFRFRKLGRMDVYLPGPYGSPAFVQAYEDAVAGTYKSRAKVPTVDPKSLAGLIVRFKSSMRYADLSDIRKKTLQRELDWLWKEAGDLPFDRFKKAHVEALMKLKKGPAAANTVKKNMSMLFNFAIKEELLDVNPAQIAYKRKTNQDGYHAWDDDEIRRFLAVHPAGSKARLALYIFLYTGASRQDAAMMTRENLAKNRVIYSRGKTRVGANLPIMPELAEEVARLPADQFYLLAHGAGRPYKAETLGNWFRNQCNAAGLPHCSAHGLRKAGATRLADTGASEWEIASYLAHKDTQTAAIYARTANRAKLADSGMARLKRSEKE